MHNVYGCWFVPDYARVRALRMAIHSSLPMLRKPCSQSKSLHGILLPHFYFKLNGVRRRCFSRHNFVIYKYLVRERWGFSSSYLACSSESVISTARSFRKSFCSEFIKSFRLAMAQKWTTVDIAMLPAVGSRDNELQSSYNDERIIMCEKWIR